MKNIIILFICANYAFSTFAQEKKEPTKKETFDFIVYIISEAHYPVWYRCNENYTNRINSQNFDNQTIEFDRTNGGDRFYRNSNIKLDKIKKTAIIKDLNKDECVPVYAVKIEFIESFSQSFLTPDGVHSTKKENVLYIGYVSKENANKLLKALNHLKKLNGGSRTTYFDD